MKIQNQGYKECALAVLAMLADTPLDDVRAMALDYMKSRGSFLDNWADYVTKSQPYYLAKALDHVAGQLGMGQVSHAFQYNTKYPPAQYFELIGRGVVWMYNTRERFGHVMAYENGLVYDPSKETEPRTLDDLVRTKYSGWVVAKITRTV